MEFKNFIRAQAVKRFRYFIPGSLVLLLCSYGSIVPAVAGGPEAHLKGEFGPLHTWPTVPIHMTLIPDGRVFVVGSKTTRQMKYTIWDPSAGTGSSAFETLSNTTGTSIFCAGQALIPETGQALILGGDTASSHTSHVNMFDPVTDMLVPQTSMAFSRWYSTAVTLPNGEHLVLGGRNVRPASGTVAVYAATPEIRAADGNWRTLSSATSAAAYGGGGSWAYPRAWVNPQGSVFVLAHAGSMFKLDTSGTGTLSKYTKKALASSSSYSSVMFAPGRILSIRKNRAAIVVDINGTGEPVVSAAGNLAKDRQFGNATVLADGRVWVNGGSSTGNNLTGAALDSELWDPATMTSWATAASAATARLYHSAALLLPDGTVLTGGGTGPLNQRNGEIYYPPYLFKADGTGDFAPRPETIEAPTTVIGWDQEFSVEATESITRVTLVHAGTVTHAFNNEQRFFDLSIPQTGNIVTVRSPAINVAPPGFYLLFVWNAAGTPSVAKFIHIG